METLDFRPFSYPTAGCAQRHTLLIRLFAEDAQNRVRTFIRRMGGTLAASSSGLAETLSQWTQTEPSLSQTRGFPLRLKAYHQPHLDPVWVAAVSALHLHAGGMDGEWRARFQRETPLR